jgi:hypothetical protein
LEGTFSVPPPAPLYTKSRRRSASDREEIIASLSASPVSSSSYRKKRVPIMMQMTELQATREVEDDLINAPVVAITHDHDRRDSTQCVTNPRVVDTGAVSDPSGLVRASIPLSPFNEQV